MTNRVPATIVGWSGEGSVSDLSRTIAAKLVQPAPAHLRLTRDKSAIIISGEDPVAVARRISRLPGTSWIAVGYEFRGAQECLDALGVLASRYLKAGETFSVSANVSLSEVEEGDLVLDSNSAILKTVHGSRVLESQPTIRFRIEMLNDAGVCGVELRRGPDGVPTDRHLPATCLVSGGYHSSVMAWLTVLSGYSLTMIHARETGDGSEESIRQVARLYSEISSRVDPSTLSLVLLEGTGESGDKLKGWIRKRLPDSASGGIVLAGVHRQCRGAAGAAAAAASWFIRDGSVTLPLLLFQEDDVVARREELGVRLKPEDGSPRLRFAPKKKKKSSTDVFTYKIFGGVEADQNQVLDSLLASEARSG